MATNPGGPANQRATRVTPQQAGILDNFIRTQADVIKIISMAWKRRAIQSIPARNASFSREDVKKYRDSDWEKIAGPFIQLAIKQCNDLRDAWNALRPVIYEIPQVRLDPILEAVYEGCVDEIYEELQKLREEAAETSLADGMLAGPTVEVHLPLNVVDSCSVCQRAGKLHLCAACRERIYCSAECQKQDWGNHKPICGKTDKVDLITFHGFLATVLDGIRCAPERAMHEATRYKIANSPNPPHHRPRIVVLGEALGLANMDEFFSKWWPTARSEGVARVLHRRIEREGWLVPACAAICFALLSQIYTTTWVSKPSSYDGREHRRTRFFYDKSPINDFGIVKGALDLPLDGVRMYIREDGTPFDRVQDPRDHYWIYFTTLGGSDIMVDCGLYSYDKLETVSAVEYWLDELPPLWPTVPVTTTNISSSNHKYMFNVQKEKQRFSVLRNTNLHGAIKAGTEDPEVLWAFMNQVAGRSCSQTERFLAMTWVHRAYNAMKGAFDNRSWLKWPKIPVAITEDEEDNLILPGDTRRDKDEYDEQFYKEVAKMGRRYNRGRLTGEQFARGWTPLDGEC